MRGLLALVLMLAACAPASSPTAPRQALEIERFFDGSLTGQGRFRDVFGHERQRFDMELAGAREGDTLSLAETFRYDDGLVQRRVWRMTRTGPDSWRGTAEGVVGTAVGTMRDGRFNWRYTADQPTGDGVRRLAFDLWLEQVDERHVVNRGYVSRLGLPVGVVEIDFERRDRLGARGGTRSMPDPPRG